MADEVKASDYTRSTQKRDFVAKSSQPQVLLMLLLLVIWLFVGLWMAGTIGSGPASHRYPHFVISALGWSSIILSAIGGKYWIERFIRGSEELRVNSSGIRSLSWSDKTIPWSEIRGVTVWNYGSHAWIVLHLSNPSLFPGRGASSWLGAVRRKLTGGDILLSMVATDRTIEEAMAAIDQFNSPQLRSTSHPI